MRGGLKVAAFSHRDPTREPNGAELDRLLAQPGGAPFRVSAVLASGESQLLSEHPDRGLRARCGAAGGDAHRAQPGGRIGDGRAADGPAQRPRPPGRRREPEHPGRHDLRLRLAGTAIRQTRPPGRGRGRAAGCPGAGEREALPPGAGRGPPARGVPVDRRPRAPDPPGLAAALHPEHPARARHAPGRCGVSPRPGAGERTSRPAAQPADQRPARRLGHPGGSGADPAGGDRPGGGDPRRSWLVFKTMFSARESTWRCTLLLRWWGAGIPTASSR